MCISWFLAGMLIGEGACVRVVLVMEEMSAWGALPGPMFSLQSSPNTRTTLLRRRGARIGNSCLTSRPEVPMCCVL